MSPLVSGKGVPSAAVYDPKLPGPHRVLVLTTAGASYSGCTASRRGGQCTAHGDWNEALPADWLPSSVGETELVVLIGTARDRVLGKQAYTFGPISAISSEVDLELRVARTGKLLATYTFKGSDPRPFPQIADLGQSRLEGSPFVYAALEDWLCPRVVLQGCSVPLRTTDGRVYWAFSTAFSPDGKTLVSGSTDTAVRLWRVSDGALLRTLNGYTGEVSSVGFSPDGQTLVAGSYGASTKLWWLSDGGVLPGWESGPKSAGGFAFSPDGRTLASWSIGSSPQLWRASDGSLLRTAATSLAFSLAFSPDGQTVASGDYEPVHLWRVSDGVVFRSMVGHTSHVVSLAFSPDGQTLASGSTDKTVRLWRVSDGTMLWTLNGHTGDVTNVVFSPDGQYLASGSSDTAVRLWRVSDGVLVRTMEPHASTVSSLAFTPDGQTLAMVANDGTIRRWQVR